MLIALQVIGLGWCLFAIVKALLDETSSDCGLTGKGLIPFFVIAMLMVGALSLITLAVLRYADRRYASVAFLFVAFITVLPLTSQLMNWIRR